VRLAINNNVANSQVYRKDANGRSLIGLIVTRDVSILIFFSYFSHIHSSPYFFLFATQNIFPPFSQNFSLSFFFSFFSQNSTMKFPQQHLWGDPVDQDIRGSWGVTLLSKQRYIIGFNQITPKDMRLYMQYGNTSDYVTIAIRYPAGTVFDCASCVLQANWYPDMKPNKVNSLAEVENGDGKKFLRYSQNFRNAMVLGFDHKFIMVQATI
jgi:hypothetical protein